MIYGVAIAALVLLDIGYIRGRWGFVLDTAAIYLVLLLRHRGRPKRSS